MKIKGIKSLLSERKEIDFMKELFLLKGRKENIKEGYSFIGGGKMRVLRF